MAHVIHIALNWVNLNIVLQRPGITTLITRSFLRSHQGDPAITHNIMRFDFTTYNVHRGQDVINLRTPHLWLIHSPLNGVFMDMLMYSGAVTLYLALPVARDMSMDWVHQQVQETRMIGANTLSIDLLTATCLCTSTSGSAEIQQDNITVQSMSTSHVAEDDEDARNSGEDDEGRIDEEDDDDDNPIVNPEQWHGSSQESLLEQYKKMYASEPTAFLSNAHDHYMDPPAMLDSFLFDNPSLMPNSGNFIDLNNIDFISYLSVGHGPMLYPLYLTVHISLYAYVLTSIIHHSVFKTEQMAGVPIYVNSFYAVNAQLDLPVKSTRAGPDNRFYVVYDGVSSNVSSTVIHLALHPTGYYPWSNVDLTAFQAISDAHNSGSILIIPTLMMPGNVNAPDSANGDEYEHSIPGDPVSALASPTVTSNLLTIYSWILCSGQLVHSTPASAHQSQAGGGSTQTSLQQKAKKAAKAEGGLKNVIGRLPKWRKAFAYLWIELRVSVCTGEIRNPHLFNFESWAAAIQLVWPHALSQANIDSSDLEIVKLIKTGTYMTLEIQRLLQLFIRPKSNILPISLNGFAWFLTHQIAKEIMWHSQQHSGVKSIHPFRLCLYWGPVALLDKYSTLTKIPVDLLIQYPTLAEVYDQLYKMAVVLVNEHDDEDHPGLMSSLTKLCNIS
ncbi:uncharacterized protein BJ212DRAFT_1297456 [Suillus subaureus]|uniref:Uncharacterized protein n=1 Tax=Suillus subaureus TaxID=48587 RepID=A0A9P7JGI8_9AGAM|nr:uncharacterized protein BJ212DRAFT_1297456 [Suillus subaureus]KAG1820992.1 hypothetical protein BJ212DRAFT_1297456 [Suillus subaureus]